MKQVTIKQIKSIVCWDENSNNNELCSILCDKYFSLSFECERTGKNKVAEIYRKKAMALHDMLDEVGFYDAYKEVE